jgi:hypothetical protein
MKDWPKSNPWIDLVIEFVVLPVVFGLLLFLKLYRAIPIVPLDLAIAALGVSPFLIRLVRKNLKEFEIGKDGMKGKTRDFETGGYSPEVPKTMVLSNAEPITENPKASSEFDKLEPLAKKLLTTLWLNQKKSYGENASIRWGFKLRLFDEGDFNIAAAPLVEKGYVEFTPERGLAYLQNAGMEFCRKNSKEIESYPEMWRPPSVG